MTFFPQKYDFILILHLKYSDFFHYIAFFLEILWLVSLNIETFSPDAFFQNLDMILMLNTNTLFPWNIYCYISCTIITLL